MVTPNSHSATRTVGGASFPYVTVSWPLAIATTDETGVCVDVRLGFLRKLVSQFMDPDPKGQSSFFAASWSEISSVDVGPRSVVFHVNDRRGCRFVTLRRRHLQPLVDDLISRGLLLNKVRTTLGWFISR